jgi:ArsR family transcriptional regulator
MMIDMYKALADENRYEIVRLLAEKSLCVCEIEAKMQISQNLASHHLSVLKKSGLIDNCRCGKNNYYSLNQESLNKLINQLRELGDKNENISTGIGMCDVQKATRNC